VVVGAGPVGARRARTLLDAGAEVVVVAPEVDPSLEPLEAAGGLRVLRRPFEEQDLAGAVLVVAATGVAAVDERVGAAAGALGIPVNRADDATRGDLAFPSAVHRGPVTLAVSTAGRSPVVARWVAGLLGDGLDELIGLGPHGYELLVEVVESVGRRLREAGTGVTSADWRRALDRSILELIDQGRVAEAKERLLACLSSS
jgi:precorrin-2 dehydrogenase / sirohydrochlorin ferrochelatase